MRFKALIAAISISVLSTAAHAQVVNLSNVAPNFDLAVVGDCSQGGIGTSGNCVSAGRGIPLNYYATSTDLATANGQISALNGQVTALNGQFASQATALAALNQKLSSTNALSRRWVRCTMLFPIPVIVLQCA